MAIALIAHTGVAGSASGGTTTAINTSGANLIVVSISSYTAYSTLTDSNGNTWTALNGYFNSSAFVKLYYCYAPTVGASHTFTAAGATNYPAICVSAFSGAATSPFDVQNGSATGSPGSITPSASNGLVITASVAQAPGTPTIDSGMTITDVISYSSGISMGGAMAYIIQTAATAISPTWSTPAGSSAIASFFAAASSVSSIKNIQSISRIQSIQF